MTDSASSTWLRWFWLVLAMFCAGCMWYYVSHIWAAGQSPQFTDLYAPWWGSHEVLLHERNPYTPAVAHEIQTVIYGAPISSNYPGDPAEMGGGFSYPLHVAFLMTPTLWTPFPVVREIAFWIFPILVLVSLRLWLYALAWRRQIVELLTISLFTLGSYPVLQVIKLQNLSVLASCLVAGGLAAIVADRLVFAGILLAVATFKPQFVILLIPWLALWTIQDWRGRRSLVWGFLGCTTLLLLGSELLLRGWLAYFLKVVIAYRQYTYGHSLLDVWFTQRGGPFVAAAFLLGVTVLCWKYRSAPASSSSFFLVCSLVLATTLMVIPTIEPHAQLLLLPGLLVLLRYRNVICKVGKLHRLLFASILCLLAFGWIGACGMTVAAIWLPHATLIRWWILPLSTSPLLPLGTLLPLASLLPKAEEIMNGDSLTGNRLS
jgi:hypothetical protein